jgi:hypothetical protein
MGDFYKVSFKLFVRTKEADSALQMIMRNGLGYNVPLTTIGSWIDVSYQGDITNPAFFCLRGIGGPTGFQCDLDIDDFKIEPITNAPLAANHADLIGYSDTELGITDKTTQTAKLDFYTKTTANFWNGSGNEVKTGLPELKNALLLDGTHTISFPLSGTVVKTFKGYAYQAYRLKAGESLTPKEVLELDNNLLFANPSSSIRRKLDAYYNFNSIDTTSGNRIMDLIGTNHATLSGSGFTTVTINSLR